MMGLSVNKFSLLSDTRIAKWLRRAAPCLFVLFLIFTYLGTHLSHKHNISSRQKRDVTVPFKDEIISSNDLLQYRAGWKDLKDHGLLRYIRHRWLVGPSSENYNLKSKHGDDVSQFGQSKFIDEALGGLENGFFVECGAADGEMFSNTLFFERMRGWTGLLVEANPVYYRELLNKNRAAYSINACLSIQNSTDQLQFRPAGLFGGIEGTMDETHLRAIGRGDPNTLVTAQCIPLTSILHALGVDHVHYFSLDVEGPELSILKTLPLEEIRIDVISVEYRLSDNVHINETGTLEKLTQIRQFFKATGRYDELGIVPMGTHDNPAGTDSRGLDVIFKRK